MRTVQDVEAFILASGRHYDTLEDNLFVLLPSAEGLAQVVIKAGDPVVVSVQVGSLPPEPERQLALFRRMLELNASDLLYCAYGLQGDTIVLGAAQPLENFASNELMAILSDLDLAMLQHIPELFRLASSTGAEHETTLPTT